MSPVRKQRIPANSFGTLFSNIYRIQLYVFSDIVLLIIIIITKRISQFIQNYFHIQIKHNCKLMINFLKKIINWWLIGRTDSVDSRLILHFWRITDIYILIKKKHVFLKNFNMHTPFLIFCTFSVLFNLLPCAWYF